MPDAQKSKRLTLDELKAHHRKRRARFAVSEGMLDHLKEAELRYKVPADSPLENSDYILEGVRNGESTLLDVYEDGEKIGWLIYQIIECELGDEFLMVACYGRSPDGEDLIKAGLPIFENLAKQKGCKSMRLHTGRAPIVEKLTKPENGFFLSEFILRKEI